MDVLVLCSESIHPMTLVQVYPIGVMRMIDNGALDDKIIAVPFSDPTYLGIASIDGLPPHIFDEIMHFFTVYKQLENKETDVRSLFGRTKAEEIIREAIDCYDHTYGNRTHN